MDSRIIDAESGPGNGQMPEDNVNRPNDFYGIAIVEDEVEFVRLLQKLFTKRNIPICFIAYDGGGAVELVRDRQKRPRAILMDYRLGTMNGIEAMGKILKVAPDIRFIFLSADADAKDEALKAGAWAFLKKPSSTKDILATVSRALS